MFTRAWDVGGPATPRAWPPRSRKRQSGWKDGWKDALHCLLATRYGRRFKGPRATASRVRNRIYLIR